MKPKAKIAIICALLLLFYIAGYLYFRLSGDIVHFQNRGLPSGPVVKAPAAHWLDFESQMADKPGAALLRVLVFTKRAKPVVLNTVFWPLRKVEAACRSLNKN